MSGGDEFIVCQIGAREHYAVARTFSEQACLEELITDLWIAPGSALAALPGPWGQKLRGRYHPGLEKARIKHFNGYSFLNSIRSKRNGSRWASTIARNKWFQKKVANYLHRKILLNGSNNVTVLAYSYAARDIFRKLRKTRVRKVLLQIDGGEEDEKLIQSIWKQRSRDMPDRAPLEYWAAWREECDLADMIVVNSEWARDLLICGGVSFNKIVVSPAIYDPPSLPATFSRGIPARFTPQRPLKALFLGSLTLRKGVADCLDAARMLRAFPVEFTFVGDDPEGFGDLINQEPNAVRMPRVPRGSVHQYYTNADVFLFPTHSDGFGLTQIEALAAGLPVVASSHCARLVEHGHTGFVLSDVSGSNISSILLQCLDNPQMLANMSREGLAFSKNFGKRGRRSLLDILTLRGQGRDA